MVEKNLEKDKHLSPEDKIKKLKKYMEQEKEELKKTEKLILEEQEEIERHDKINKELEKLTIPKYKEVDIKKLFRGDLEDKVKKEDLQVSDEELQAMRQYNTHLSREPMQDIYNKVRDIQTEVEQRGYMSKAHRQELNAIGYAVQYKQKDIDAGKYKTATERIEDVIGSTRSILKYLRS